MKFKVLFVSCAVLLTLTGCKEEQADKQPPAGIVTEKPAPAAESNLTLDQVKTAIEAQEDIELHLIEDSSWVLNNVKPNRYSAGRPLEKAAYSESISIYVFTSEQARIDGLKDFNMQKEKYNMQVPIIYEHKNVLILYWHREGLDNLANARFDKSIKAAIQKL